MRAAFLALLLVNMMFLAWAEWIDVPVLPPNAIAGLPRLRLASDAGPSGADAAAPSNASAAANAAEQGAGNGSTVPGDGASSAQLTGSSQSAGASLAAQCVSVGPFASAAAATQASKQLGGQDLSPRQRVAQSRPARWYWVYLPGPDSASRVKQVLRTLNADRIAGAQPMSADGKQPISLGMFQNEKLAARRLRLARGKGFHPVLAQRLVSEPVYWLDLWVPGGAQALPLGALKTGTAAVGTQRCPAGETAPWSAPQAASPGLPAPQASVKGGPAGP